MVRFPRRSQLILAAAAATLAIACSSSEPATAPIVLDLNPVIPSWWGPLGSGASSYTVGTIHGTRHGGVTALAIVGTDTSQLEFAGVGQYIRADNFRGQRIRLSAWVREENVTGTAVGLWLRIDGPGVTQGLDDFSNHTLIGTENWHQVDCILDVPNNAIGIAFGARMSGKGKFLVDDMTLGIVPTSVATTNQLRGFTVSDHDSTTWARFYQRSGSTPANLDFETP